MFIDEATKKYPEIGEFTPQVFNIQNIWDYSMDKMPEGPYDLSELSISLLPPFESTWFEFKISGESVGVLALCTRNPNGTYVLELAYYYDFTMTTRLRITSFATERLNLDSMGKPQPYMLHGVKSRNLIVDNRFSNDPGQILPAVNNLLFAVVLALNFLHCKNVTVVNNALPKPHSKHKVREQRGWHYTFKTLQIGPVTRLLATEGRSETVGVMQAMHICRGHFKTYTADAPLMGKHQGTYWWSDQVRGSANAGIVDKDYELKAPVSKENNNE